MDPKSQVFQVHSNSLPLVKFSIDSQEPPCMRKLGFEEGNFRGRGEMGMVRSGRIPAPLPLSGLGIGPPTCLSPGAPLLRVPALPESPCRPQVVLPRGLPGAPSRAPSGDLPPCPPRRHLSRAPHAPGPGPSREGGLASQARAGARALTRGVGGGGRGAPPRCRARRRGPAGARALGNPEVAAAAAVVRERGPGGGALEPAWPPPPPALCAARGPQPPAPRPARGAAADPPRL